MFAVWEDQAIPWLHCHAIVSVRKGKWIEKMTNCLIGRHGLIGSALARKLGEFTPYPTDDTRVVYQFGSPAHPDFERAPEYHMRAAFDSFTALLPWCREHGALFVYPSSALVHEMDTQFTRHKKALEALVGCYDVRTIGLRIFPVYGPGETRTVIGQWCRAMINGERPVVYGDGNQMRDFSYSDDVATQIIAACGSDKLPQHCLMDIGSGQLTSFNAIVGIINRHLGTRLEPQYVAVPVGYSKGIAAPRWTGGVTLEEGIRLVLEGMAVSHVDIEDHVSRLLPRLSVDIPMPEGVATPPLPGRRFTSARYPNTGPNVGRIE